MITKHDHNVLQAFLYFTTVCFFFVFLSESECVSILNSLSFHTANYSSQGEAALCRSCVSPELGVKVIIESLLVSERLL